MQTNFKRLQKQYPVFIYHKFAYELISSGLQITFSFEIGEHKFFPNVIIHGVTQKQLDRLGKEAVDRFVFNLGLAEIPSYWKLTVSPVIQIESGYLNTMQIAFWRKLLEKGMGEFFFVNDIPPFAPEVEIKAKALDQEKFSLPAIRVLGAVMVPVGGGKDSIITMEMMQKSGKHITFFTIGNDEASEDIITVFEGKYGRTPRIHVRRTLDPTLLELNARGYLNGHTPFSSIVAFSSLFAATLFHIPFIALSNEKSANEETGVYQGVNINHQYSKTFEFESDFRDYVVATFPSAPTYFSLLRPLYEIQIMRIFTGHSEYFNVFRSCNIGKKTNSWCGDCAKCLFVFLLLSAFLPAKEVTRIFGKDLLADPELVPLLKQLTGDAPMKAFECVGTKAETMVALYLSWKRRRLESVVPIVLDSYQPYIESHEHELEAQAKEILKSFDQNHLMPQGFEKVVRDAI